MSQFPLRDTVEYPKTLALAIYTPQHRKINIESYFEEFLNLIKSNRTRYDEVVQVKLRSIDPGYFLTKGKLQEIKKLCDDHNIEEVIISEPLSARQERNIADYLDCKVFDRTKLILEIFEKAANSSAGKIQVEIARLQHKKSRLSGKGIHLSQQAGMIGVRGGPGETAKEAETRYIDMTILQLKRQLDRMHKARNTQRKQRLANKVVSFCLIGYTNAGKSTILNALTKGGVLAEDKLFATLDTTTRELYLNGKKKGVISDTVGFIQNLPHHLVESFKSTLSELQYADLLLHVIDTSDSNFDKHIEVVNQILEDLDVHKDILYVFNKIDKADIEKLEPIIQRYQPHVLTNSISEQGLDPLKQFLSKWKRQ